MERAEAEAVYDAGREACVEFLVELTARHERQIARLEARIERLEEKLRENSGNSSRPPSSEPPGKPAQPKRSASTRRQGGQPGHEGTTRKLVAESELDEIVDHWPERCAGCGVDLGPGGEEALGEPYRHQVAELLPIAVRFTEHRAHTLRCAQCGHRTRAQLPKEIGKSAFGPRLQAAIALFSVRNRISRRDASELCEELFGCGVSVGSVDAICQRASYLPVRGGRAPFLRPGREGTVFFALSHPAVVRRPEMHFGPSLTGLESRVVRAFATRRAGKPDA